MATGGPPFSNCRYPRTSGQSTTWSPTCGSSDASFTMPCHGIASWPTPSGAGSCVKITGPSNSVRSPSRIVITGAHPYPNWKIRRPSASAGWFTRTSAAPSDAPAASCISIRDTKSMGCPVSRNVSSKSTRRTCMPE